MDFLCTLGEKIVSELLTELTETNRVSYRLPNKVPRKHRLSHNSLSTAGELERHRCWISVRLTLVVSSGHSDGCSLQCRLFYANPITYYKLSFVTVSSFTHFFTHSWLYAMRCYEMMQAAETKIAATRQKMIMSDLVNSADLESALASSQFDATWLMMVRIPTNPQLLRLIFI